MTDLLVHRTDPARNICRFHLLDVQLGLFGQWNFIRE
jgi:hypothetical protein